MIARNTLYPSTKTDGIQGKKFILFTSAHGHYSLEKAAQMFGFGSSNVRSVPVNESGQLRPDALDAAITKAVEDGETPFYVNATAGTTVLGSYDNVGAIADVLAKHKETTPIWLHVDGSWGGPVVFSKKHAPSKLPGIEKADSIGVTPHKMLSVPMTCSFLLCKDMRQCQKAMTLPAGYLFHNPDDDDAEGGDASAVDSEALDLQTNTDASTDRELFDLADLTPQCGRKGDALKMALSWIYYGQSGLESRIDTGFEMSAYLADVVAKNSAFTLVSENPPPCWQVCFYYNKQNDNNKNSKITEEIARKLIPRGFMVDYAPGEDGRFFRVVVNGGTMKSTIEGLVKAIEEVGKDLKI